MSGRKSPSQAHARRAVLTYMAGTLASIARDAQELEEPIARDLVAAAARVLCAAAGVKLAPALLKLHGNSAIDAVTDRELAALLLADAVQMEVDAAEFSSGVSETPSVELLKWARHLREAAHRLDGAE